VPENGSRIGNVELPDFRWKDWQEKNKNKRKMKKKKKKEHRL